MQYEILRLSGRDIKLIVDALENYKLDSGGFHPERNSAIDSLVSKIQNRNSGVSLSDFVQQKGFVLSDGVRHNGQHYQYAITTRGSGEPIRKEFVMFVAELKREYMLQIEVAFRNDYTIDVWSDNKPDSVYK